jgi:hypothetical protein
MRKSLEPRRNEEGFSLLGPEAWRETARGKRVAERWSSLLVRENL